ncbi:hypothetical protein LG311_10310 [Sutcliffiella horikoshii]|uniref:hypothetical protein n=1 Tax=Sutcliffiella horikoshii TaxID=79883 RepID=UPI00384BE341
MSKFKQLGVAFNRLFRNDLNANFDEVERSLNVQKGRVDNLIASTPQPSEVVDMRVDEQGVIHAMARDRLAADSARVDGKFAEVDAELSQKAQQSDLEKEAVKIKSYVHVSEFNTVGDGLADDTLAIQNAINYCVTNNVKLKLEPLSNYRITQTMNINGNFSFYNENGARPRIFSESQNFDLINVSGQFAKSTTLRTSATVNTKFINVEDVAEIKVGMLVEIISSKSWYHDPRPESTDARKAELHLVDEVDVSGRKVYLTDPLFDGYDLTKETVTLNFYNPIEFNMGNVILELGKPLSPTDSIRKTALTISYTVDSKIKNVKVVNSANSGISDKHNYNLTVTGGRVKGSNNYYSGYGIQTVGSTRSKLLGVSFSNCRRGIDVSGAQIPSHLTIVEGCSHFGSGKNSLEERYGFNDDHSAGAAVFGFGTHGPADHTIFRNNQIGFLHVGISDRGRNTVVEGNYFLGDFKDVCISHDFGENIQVINNYAYDGYSGVKEKGVFDGGANINTRKPKTFLRIHDKSLQLLGDSYYRIENNYVMVQDTFVELYGAVGGGAIPTVKNLIVKNNQVVFSPQFSTDTAVLIKNNTVDSASVLISGSTIKDNEFERLGGGSIKYYDRVDPRDASEIESSKSYSFYLADDRVSTVTLGNGNINYVRLGLDCAGANGLIRVTQGTTALNQWSTPVNLAASTGVLTGTTGSDGTMNLSLQDGILYVENRLGNTQRIIITVFGVM